MPVIPHHVQVLHCGKTSESYDLKLSSAYFSTSSESYNVSQNYEKCRKFTTLSWKEIFPCFNVSLRGYFFTVSVTDGCSALTTVPCALTARCSDFLVMELSTGVVKSSLFVYTRAFWRSHTTRLAGQFTRVGSERGVGNMMLSPQSIGRRLLSQPPPVEHPLSQKNGPLPCCLPRTHAYAARTVHFRLGGLWRRGIFVKLRSYGSIGEGVGGNRRQMFEGV